ncbi:MAG: ddl [Acidimicrobiales bacterium]|nr:ddl [Acidimicrobiales bacterium]
MAHSAAVTESDAGLDRIRLVVLFGGMSAEHEVSCVSAAHVLRAADPARYELVPVGISTEGRWSLSESTLRALAAGPDTLPDALDPAGPLLEPAPTVAPTRPGEQVVVFPLLHGPMGEDGTVQGLLELAGVAYVGSGVLASALCMDKAAAKVAIAAAGIPQVRHLAARDVDVDAAFLARVATELKFPVFVKPANLGSSVGVSRAADADELASSVERALRFDEWVVVEEAVDAHEIEVGVLGNADPRASVPGEIVPTHDFYDYEDKYLDGAAALVVPAELPAEVAAEARRLAVAAYRALRCDGLARADFFWEEGGRGLLLNEVNTMPGFTPYSMFPSLWAATGLSYPALIDELVRLAIDRHAHRAPHRRTPRQ